MRRQLVWVWTLVALLAGTGVSMTAAPQGLVGMQANWKDLETWSHLVESNSQNELGLGLQPTGGAVVAFLGRLSVRNPRTPPTEVQVQVAPKYMANSAQLRTKTLVFLADAKTDLAVKFDLGPRLLTDNDAPGGIIQNGLARMQAVDFVRLTQSTTLTGSVLGLSVVFRPDQIKAMGAFADKLHLPKPDPPKDKDKDAKDATQAPIGGR